MELVFKALIVCLVSAIFGIVLKKNVPDMAFALQIAGTLLVTALTLRVLEPICSFVQEVSTLLDASGIYIKPVLKASVIGVVSCIGSALCKDAGQAAFSSALETLGILAAIYAALPLLQLFVHTIGELL